MMIFLCTVLRVWRSRSKGARRYLLSITNNALQMSKQHPLLRAALLRVKLSYNPTCWTCIGPKLVTKSAQTLAGTKDIRKIQQKANFSFVEMRRIMVVDWPESKSVLFPMKPSSFLRWKKLFANSSAVHFFSHTSNMIKVYDDPRYSAYALLGPHYCPISYYSTTNFWWKFPMILKLLIIVLFLFLLLRLRSLSSWATRDLFVCGCETKKCWDPDVKIYSFENISLDIPII